MEKKKPKCNAERIGYILENFDIEAILLAEKLISVFPSGETKNIEEQAKELIVEEDKRDIILTANIINQFKLK